MPSILGKVCGFPALLGVLLAGIIFWVLPKTIADPDLGWHLRNAEFLIHTHSFLRQDLYSFTTQGKPWMDHEWLSEIPFYLALRHFGPRGIFFVTYAAIASILLGIFGLATLLSKNSKSAFLIALLAIFGSSVSFGPRTLLFGWIFLLAELAILYTFREGLDVTWSLPFLFLLWVNAHGSWMIGLVVLGLFVASGLIEGAWGSIEATRWSGVQSRKLIWVSTLSVLALFINPYGWRLVLYPFDMAFRQKLNIASVLEWRTLDFHSPRGKIVFMAGVAAFLLQLVKKKKWMLHEVLFLMLGMYAALTYSRFLFLAAILVLPLFAKDLSAWIPPYRVGLDKPWLNAPIMIVFAVVVVLQFPTDRQLLDSGSDSFPNDALAYLQHFHPKGNVFNDYQWGGYLIWNARQIPVFVDSRVDIFEHNGVFKDYLDAMRLKETFRVFDTYSIRYVLFRKNEPLSYLLEHTPGWKVDYQDNTSILFERTGGSLEAKK